jgi:phosphatidylglycerol---prolipoprotein diacylglyceryl transferase
MMESWQHIAERIDPVAFTVWFFPVRWYAVCFIVGYGALISSLTRRSTKTVASINLDMVWDAAAVVFFGVLIGGRLGFALLYEPTLFVHPVSLFWQTDSATGAFSGVRGMSFFGALFGALIACYAFSKSRKISFPYFTDFIATSVPLALFFGRIGNFLNLELPGRRTDVLWAVNFPNAIDGAWEYRHPSQLYEAFLEGLVLYIVMIVFRKRRLPEGVLSIVFLCGYAVMRFIAEFFREPDPGSSFVFGWMTTGQVLCLILFVCSSIAYVLLLRRKVVFSKSDEVRGIPY